MSTQYLQSTKMALLKSSPSLPKQWPGLLLYVEDGLVRGSGI